MAFDPDKPYPVSLPYQQWSDLLKFLAYAEDHARQEVLRYQIIGMPSSSVHFQMKAAAIRLLITSIQSTLIGQEPI